VSLAGGTEPLLHAAVRRALMPDEHHLGATLGPGPRVSLPGATEGGGFVKRGMVIGLAVTIVALVGVCAQVYHVHALGGELRLFPSAAPPVIHEWGRDYERGPGATSQVVPHHLRRVGVTPGGGTVYRGGFSLPKPFRHLVPVVIWVREHTGYVEYALEGGP
jgi:hypothetical protein